MFLLLGIVYFFVLLVSSGLAVVMFLIALPLSFFARWRWIGLAILGGGIAGALGGGAAFATWMLIGSNRGYPLNWLMLTLWAMSGFGWAAAAVGALCGGGVAAVALGRRLWATRGRPSVVACLH